MADPIRPGEAAAPPAESAPSTVSPTDDPSSPVLSTENPDPPAPSPANTPSTGTSTQNATQDASPPDARIAAAQSAPVEEPARIRVFLAVNLPIAVVRRVAEDVAALRASMTSEGDSRGMKVAWAPPANLHVTLKFLGMIDPESVEAIRGTLGRELSSVSPGAVRASFDLEARGMGAFPNAVDPRVLWVGLREQPALFALQQEIEKQLEALGFPREERPFHPHITIARVRPAGVPSTESTANPSLESLFAERAERSYGLGRIAEVVVYESPTTGVGGRGAEYRALARIPLGPR